MSVIRVSHRPAAHPAARPAARPSSRPSSRLGMRPAVQALAIGGAFVLGVVIALALPGTARGAEPPVGADDWYLAPHTGELSVDVAGGVLVNDAGTALTAELWTEPAFGTVLLSADGGFVYTATEPVRSDAFAYLVTDADGVSTEPVSVRIRLANDLPDCTTVRLADQVQNSVVEADLGAACTDPDGDPMSFSYQNPDIPDGSIWDADASGHLRFLPPPDWVGTATVLFTASDGFGMSPATVFAVEILPAE